MVNGGTTKSHLTDGDSPASALLNDRSATYVPGVSEKRGSVTSFFLFDLLGSVRAVSGAGGAATEFSLSDAFGNPFLTSDFGGATTAGRPFGFVGAEQYQQDAESGLMLLGNRFYDPSIGRFLSSDPAEDGSNWYAYVNNRPTRLTDPRGLETPPTTPPETAPVQTPKEPDPKNSDPFFPPVTLDPYHGAHDPVFPGFPGGYKRPGWLDPSVPIRPPLFPGFPTDPNKKPYPKWPELPKLPGPFTGSGDIGNFQFYWGYDPLKNQGGIHLNYPRPGRQNGGGFFSGGYSTKGEWIIGVGWGGRF